MINKVSLFFICILTILFSLKSKAQNHDKITASLINFYKLDRENIYLHLNKDKYLTNETIWFKGYVLDKRTNKLNPLTTNVFISIYNENKKEIKNQLFYASNGIIIGQIKLDNNYKSGKYFIHVYTNFMNNFQENESTIEEIEIINIKDGKQKTEENTSLNIDVNFEGGKLLFQTKNTISVHITDCQNIGVSLQNVTVLDDKNRVIAKFSTNSEGYGRFDILNTQNINYTIKLENKTFQLNYQLEKPVIEGINISTNNYALKDKISITLNTNQNTQAKIENKKMILLVQKNDFANYVDIYFEAGELNKEVILDKKSLFRGINTIRLLDYNGQSISERIIYNHVNTPKLQITSSKKVGDSIFIKGNITNRIANISISSLPQKTITKTNKNSIVNTLAFENNLDQKLSNTRYYFENFDRKKEYELDIFLIGCKSKYNWNSILENEPKEKYTFDIGLNIEGKVNQQIKDKEKNKLRLFSIYGINETTTINESNEFTFKNIIAIDSSIYHFSLLKNDTKIQNLYVSSVIKNNKKPFLKEIKFNTSTCAKIPKIISNESILNFPKTEKVIDLDSISLIGIKKEKLENKNTYYNNSMSKGFKITDEEARNYLDILSFIRMNGFDVNTSGINVTITSRNNTTTTLNGSLSPLIFIDDAPIYDFSRLLGMQMQTIDEIYISRTSLGMDGSNGSIRIYRKKTLTSTADNYKTKSKQVVIKNGFQKPLPFQNLKYTEYLSESFQNFATIDWINNIYTDENGNFEFTIPHYYQKEVSLDIQGIDSEGDLHHQIISILIN